MHGVDEVRKEQGDPVRVHDAETFAAAHNIVNTDPQGLLDRLVADVSSGGVLGSVDTYAARILMERTGIEAFRDGDEAQIEKFLLLANSYRHQRSETARALRIGRDFEKDRATRHRQIITDALVQGRPVDQRRLDRVEKDIHRTTGEEQQAALDQRSVLLKEQASRAQELKEKLKQLGLDLDNPDLDWSDIRLTARGVRAIQSASSTKFDMLFEFWMNSILSAPITHARNVTGNTAFTAWEFSVQRLAEVLVNAVLPGRRASSASLGELKYMLQGFLPGFSKGMQNAVQAWDLEQSVFADEISGEGSSKLEKTERRAAIPGLAGRIIRIPARFLVAMDDFAKSVTGQMHVGVTAFRLAREEGLTDPAQIASRVRELTMNPESVAWTRAIREATRLTFQDPGGPIVSAIQQARVQLPVLRFIVPFIMTPANIFKIGIRKSPLGSLREVWKLARLGGVQLGFDQGGYKYKRQDIVIDTAEQLVAWGVTLALFPFVIPDEEDGLPRITGTAPLGWGERALMYRTAPPLSIRLSDGTWLSYNGLEPGAVAIATLVDGIHNFHRASNAEESAAVLGKALQSLVGQVEDKTFMRGIADLIRLIRDPAKGVPRWATTFGSSWVPNVIRASIREGDDYVRQNRVFAEDLPAFWSKAGLRIVQKGIPAKAVAPPPSVDLWGREIVKGSTGVPGTDWIYRMLVPTKLFKVPQDTASQIDRMLLNWNNQNPNDVKAPRVPEPYFVVQGEQVFMTDEEYHDYLRATGQRALKMARNRNWNVDNPTQFDIDAVEKVHRDARRIERNRFLGKLRRERDRRVDLKS